MSDERSEPTVPQEPSLLHIFGEGLSVLIGLLAILFTGIALGWLLRGAWRLALAF